MYLGHNPAASWLISRCVCVHSEAVRRPLCFQSVAHTSVFILTSSTFTLLFIHGAQSPPPYSHYSEFTVMLTLTSSAFTFLRCRHSAVYKPLPFVCSDAGAPRETLAPLEQALCLYALAPPFLPPTHFPPHPSQPDSQARRSSLYDSLRIPPACPAQVGHPRSPPHPPRLGYRAISPFARRGDPPGSAEVA